MNPSIHALSIPIYPVQGHEGLRPIPAHIEREAGYMLGRSPRKFFSHIFFLHSMNCKEWLNEWKIRWRGVCYSIFKSFFDFSRHSLYNECGKISLICSYIHPERSTSRGKNILVTWQEGKKKEGDEFWFRFYLSWRVLCLTFLTRRHAGMKQS